MFKLDEVFKSRERYVVNQMLEEKLLFVNFYSSLEIPNYRKYPLPGKNEGVNGSIAGGFNLGINKNIGEGKMKAAIEVIKYLTSEKFQKEIIIKHSKLFSGLTKLYDDEECCQVVNCDVIKKTQFFHRPSATMENYEYFSEKSVELFQQFLNGLISIKEVLADIENINKIYYFETKSTLGAIILVVIIILFLTIALSPILLFIPKYRKDYFKFLPIDLWMVYALGSVFMLASNLEYYYKQNIFKCIIGYVLTDFGNAFIFIPILYRLLISFPKKNKYSEWLRKNRFIYIIIFIVIYLVLSIIIIKTNTFTIKNINFKYDDFNFQICDFDNRIGEILYLIQNFLNLLLYFAICFLIFLEWNLIEFYYDLRQITFIMIIDGITLILDMILNSMNFKDYIYYSFFHIFIKLLFVFISHIYLFVLRVVFLIITKGKVSEEEEMNKIIKKISDSKNFGIEESIEDSIIQTRTFVSRKSKASEASTSSHQSKLISYHYSTSPT